MGVSVSSLYDDVLRMIAKGNGELSITDFNSYSRRAENRLLDWVTGRVEGNTLPQMYTTQKDKDFIAPFIAKYKAMVSDDGAISKPEDYYTYENLYGLSLENAKCDGESDGECGDEDEDIVQSNPIKLVDGDEFTRRQKSRIKGVTPSVDNPIAKEIGAGFEFAPKELAGVVLEYVRYPVYANAVPMIDPVYNEEVINQAASTNYEWGEYAREMLVWIICDFFFNSVREAAGKTMNLATGGAVKQP